MFVDTSGWGCAFDAGQQFHRRAANLIVASPARLVTTNLVLFELTALFTSPLRFTKPLQIRLLATLRADPRIEIVTIDSALETAAWALWESRPDKSWSFVDCASFVVMANRGLSDAVTLDHHFEQAGFVRLLK